MKIIFDSEEQKKALMDELTGCYCPSAYYLVERCANREIDFEKDCKACWENCGLEVEVINDSSGSNQT